jgi:II/X family phage/plasmid replication protein
MKAYSKFEELTTGKKNHRLPRELLNSPLLPFSENKLRLELQLRKELKKIAARHHGTEKFYAKYLTPQRCQEIFNDYLGRIEMANNFSVKDTALLKLPNSVRGTFEVHRQGHDVQSMLAKPTFYRHRRKIIELVGVDIALPAKTSNEPSNVVALVRPLEAKPVTTPNELLPYVIGL